MKAQSEEVPEPVVEAVVEAPDVSESYDSEDEYVQNRRGKVPAKWYEDEKIVGYSIKGKAIA
jgi:hypothetical protein